ncbi:MAG: hypothetical protein J5691_02790 [Bacilli bacterium]|nr:hypothetical protein [Bacilli bacterium]
MENKEIIKDDKKIKTHDEWLIEHGYKPTVIKSNKVGKVAIIINNKEEKTNEK